MISSLVAMYRKGALTAQHLAVESMRMIDPAKPYLVLDALPTEIHARMLGFSRQYVAGRMVTNYGDLPNADQVEAARAWIEDRGWTELLDNPRGVAARGRRTGPLDLSSLRDPGCKQPGPPTRERHDDESPTL